MNKKKIYNIIALYLIIVGLIGCGHNNGKYGYNPKDLPKILYDSIFSGDKYSNMDRIYGFSGHDYTQFDFINLSLEFLGTQSFDNHTIWPNKKRLPNKFNPKEWLEKGKNPGLGVKILHKEGVTGKGISIAVFDKPINPNHDEIRENITYIPIVSEYAKDYQHKGLHFHGLLCASILCGKNVGVAPDAKLYYFSVPDDGNNTYNYCLALDKLNSINDTLPESEKIRIVSISDDIRKNDKEVFNRWVELAEKAKKKGIVIVYSSLAIEHFTWGGCPPYQDKESPDNYDYNSWVRNTNFKNFKEKIILPGDNRTVAENKSNSRYIYKGEGGFSSAIPYFVGLSALVWQVNPNLELEEIYNYVNESKTIRKDSSYVVNPVELIKLIRTSIN